MDNTRQMKNSDNKEEAMTWLEGYITGRFHNDDNVASLLMSRIPRS